jgi:DNA invertase Pin-like site-specific DNA recombinase
MSGKQAATTYAYIRVSTVEQNEARQVEALSGRATQTFTDKASGKDTNRPALQEMLSKVQAGDTIVVASMDRFSRSLMDLQKTVEDLVTRGVSIEFVKEGLKFAPGGKDPMAKLMMQIMGAFAEFERTLIRERQREGIAAAKAEGKYMGRRPVFDEAKTAKLVEYIGRGMTPMEISRQMAPISRASIYNKMAELGFRKQAVYKVPDE